jgi:hypothetical protein
LLEKPVFKWDDIDRRRGRGGSPVRDLVGARRFAAALHCSILCTGTAVAGSATLTVGDEPQQVYRGFGLSFEWDSPFGRLSEKRKAEVAELLFGDLNTQVLRLWYAPGDPTTIRDHYVATGIIQHALAQGVTELLLGPGHYLGDPERHAGAMADDIRTMRDQYGVRITATGVVNEPEAEPTAPIFVPLEHYVPLAIAMREALDQAGITDVTILGLEFPNGDWGALRWFDMVAADSRALAAVDALSTHSYNMAATPELAERALSTGKEYWMTEAGGGFVDGSAEFDYAFAATASARFLNDLNNAVTHWVWFLGVSEGERDVLQKLVMCEGPCAGDGRIYKNYTYHHVEQISTAFLPGTVMRHVTSDLPDRHHLVYTYGLKPPLNAAAGVRPDGRWVLGVVNGTTGENSPHSSWDAPEAYTVTFRIPELADVASLDVEVCRTNRAVAVRCGEPMGLRYGEITVELESLELLTLVAAP